MKYCFPSFIFLFILYVCNLGVDFPHLFSYWPTFPTETLTNPSPALSRRCEKPGEFSPGRERPGAGQRSAAGLRHVQLPAANGQVWPAAPPATRDTSDQPAGRRIPLLQTPEWRRALQQPAHWNAARQKSLGGNFPTRSAAVQFCCSPETPNNAFTKTKPPAHTWLCADLEDGEQSLYRAHLLFGFFCFCSSYNLKWTNTCTETQNVHRQTAFGSLYCRKKTVAFPQPQTEKDNAERKEEKHLKQNLHLQDDFWSSAQARLSDCQAATLRIKSPQMF